MTLQISVSTSATELTFNIESSVASNVIEIYKVYANRGEVAIESLPCVIDGIIGSTGAFDFEAIPGNYLEKNGAEIPDGYTRLESVLYGKFGTGSNSRSKIPDGRGLFERQWNHGASVDPDVSSRTTRGDGTTGDHVGTKQDSAMQRITGSFTNQGLAGIVSASGVFYGTNFVNQVNVGTTGPTYNSDRIGYFDSAKSVSPNPAKTSEYETRTSNIAVLKCIKWA